MITLDREETVVLMVEHAYLYSTISSVHFNSCDDASLSLVWNSSDEMDNR